MIIVQQSGPLAWFGGMTDHCYDYAEAARVWDRLPARRAAEMIADLQQVARNAEHVAAKLPR